jgi:hypothetical protein
MENYWDYSKPLPAKGNIELQFHGQAVLEEHLPEGIEIRGETMPSRREFLGAASTVAAAAIVPMTADEGQASGGSRRFIGCHTRPFSSFITREGIRSRRSKSSVPT